MRRISVLILSILLVLAPASGLVVCAASNGTDAKSQSMSAGADGQEIVNESANEDSGEEDEVNPIDGDLSEAADRVEDDIAAEKKAQEEAERAAIVRTVVVIAVALTALLAAILLFRSRRKDKSEGKYKSKH